MLASAQTPTVVLSGGESQIKSYGLVGVEVCDAPTADALHYMEYMKRQTRSMSTDVRFAHTLG